MLKIIRTFLLGNKCISDSTMLRICRCVIGIKLSTLRSRHSIQINLLISY
jgi:hypothetical protein